MTRQTICYPIPLDASWACLAQLVVPRDIQPDEAERLCAVLLALAVPQTTMNATQLKAEIDARTARLAPQLAELESLRRQHADAISREWVAAHNVTAAQVRRSDGSDVPWFGDVMAFGRWMKETGCSLPWAEWNGRIYASAEIMAGRMSREAPGMYEHVAHERAG